MKEKLASEIADALENRGSAVKNVRILTKWLRQIKHLHIIGGNYG